MNTVALVAALGVALLVTRHLTDPRSPLVVLDHPNQRSLHSTPVPRTGGLGILAGVVVATIVLYLTGGGLPRLPGLAVAALLVGLVSFADDRASLPVGLRLVVQLAAASMVVTLDGVALAAIQLPGIVWPLPWVVGVALSILFLTWMVNLYNFMDGMDGFAGGMAVAGFGTFGLLGLAAGDGGFAAVSGMVAASALGFLMFNFPPARVFMGDVGASVLGLLAGGMALYADATGLFPLWMGVLVFSPFIVDATVTLVARWRRGEVVWEAHRSHFYQRLVGLGWSHRRTVLWEYLLMVLVASCTLLVHNAAVSAQWLAVVGITLVYALLARSVRHLERMTTAGGDASGGA